MATNDFRNQLKRLSQSIWFNLIHVLLLIIAIVGLCLIIPINFDEYTNS